jgi:hypothetical protein
VSAPLGLTDKQLDLVTRASRLLSAFQRGTFLRSIAGRLDDVANPSDDDVVAAINFILSNAGVSAGSILDPQEHGDQHGSIQKEKV